VQVQVGFGDFGEKLARDFFSHTSLLVNNVLFISAHCDAKKRRWQSVLQKAWLASPFEAPQKGKRPKTAHFRPFFEKAITQSVAMGYRKTLQNLLTMTRPQKSRNSLQYQQNHFKKSNG